MAQVLAVAGFELEGQAYAKGTVITMSTANAVWLKGRKLVEDDATIVAAAISGGATQVTHTAMLVQEETMLAVTNSQTGEGVGVKGGGSKAKGSAAVAAAINIIGETTGTETGLLAAMAAAHAAGGGVVKLKYVTYSLSATLPAYTNVTLEGQGWKPAYSDIPDSGSTQYGEGTRLLATGAFPIYQYNSGSSYDPISHTNSGDLTQAQATALYGTGSAGQGAFSNTAITQSAFRNLCLDGANVSPYGMIAGAAFRASFFYCRPAENVLFVNFTKDPFRFENFLHIDMPRVRVFNCGSLGALGASSSGTGTNYLIPGNSDFNDLLGTIPTATASNIFARGLQVYARNNTIHNLVRLVRVQCNRFNPGNYSELLTMTSGTPDIPVADLSKYVEELPFVFSASSYGLPDVVNGVSGTLYVLSRSGTSGAGTVRLSWMPGIASSLFTPTGSGTVTCYTYGFPAIEATAYDTSLIIEFSIGEGSDVESGGTAQIQFSKVANWICHANTPNTVSTHTVNIAALSSPYGRIHGIQAPTVYLSKTQGGMTSSGTVQISGTRGQGVGLLGVGLWKTGTNATQVNLNGSTDLNSPNISIPTLAMDAGNHWLPQSRGYIGSALLNRFTAAKTLGWNNDVGALQMDAAGTPTLTLPVIDATSAGQFIAIEFVQSATLATQSGQLINGLGATTTAPIPAGAKVVAWAENNNGTFSWSLLSSDASLITGAGLRDAANDAAAAALTPTVPVGGLYRNGNVVQVRLV